MRPATGAVYTLLFLVLIAVIIFVVVWGDDQTLGLTSPVGTTVRPADGPRTPVVGTTAYPHEQPPTRIPVVGTTASREQPPTRTSVVGTMFLTATTCPTDAAVMGDADQVRRALDHALRDVR